MAHIPPPPRIQGRAQSPDVGEGDNFRKPFKNHYNDVRSSVPSWNLGHKRGGKRIRTPASLPHQTEKPKRAIQPDTLGWIFVFARILVRSKISHAVEKFLLGSRKLFAGFPKPTGVFWKVFTCESGDRLENYPSLCAF